MRSHQFREWWAQHDVRIHTTSTKTFHHPIAGDFTVDVESMTINADAEQILVTYSVEPNSPSQDALRNLASRPLSGTATDGSEEHSRPQRHHS